MHRRRAVLTTVGATGLAALAGCTTAGDDDEGSTDGSPADDGSGTSDDTTETDDLIFAAGRSHTFAGNGPDETERFELDRGLLRYRYEATAVQDVFTSELVDMDRDGTGRGLDQRMLTNYLAPTAGELMSVVSGGDYLISVDVSDAWTLEVDQPEAVTDDIEPLPLEATGDTPGYVGPVELESDTEVHATHDGDASFSVHAVTTDGRWDVPVNDVGEVNSTRVFRDEGIAWISVVGDGNWSIRLE